ncbi:2-amino-4-hydroxy-6-hydroxymethyldihydropteridine diphosphokinase [Dictyobacter arantiisoli]|uniref:2-amino-4-hydroxy-6-hydroxymethyldihydropteridine diphosphokinase n=1 Tax=Dictyobacter arantiisoli TaxID=2014874 RepID=A0A5A5TH46_9CHLR|nr:2-amino-4-hydroxy-6-hydroxymethyldihydropteridine diphosphokinase [Dictyobacter arantiisoli]GCF10393.1 2-amino-4-hydroxy-6-hydroxymethyldihydropteridine diphosphokinase [Dictyobacter arantiisoli]
MNDDIPVSNSTQHPFQGYEHIIYLSLGTNIGDRLDNLRQALKKLQLVVTIQRISSVYETEPVGYLDQPDFFNIVCYGKTRYTPAEILKQAKWIEKELGRQTTFRNGPRQIDIDILLYDNYVQKEESLTLPHPRMKERAFVLIPLVEISPAVIDPLSGLTAQELLQDISSDGVVRAAVQM